MAASVMNYHGSGLRLTGGITKSRVRPAAIARRELSNPTKLKCARKMLFGPVDREENNRFCETQLKKNVAESSLRWNFDFVSGQPIRSPDSKYIWERVPPLSGDDSASVLDNGGPMMTLSSAAHIRTIQVIAAGLVSPPGSSSPSSSATSSVTSSPSTSICSVDLEEEQQQQEVVAKGNSSNSAFGDLSGAAGEASNDGVAKRMVQKKMTDFLKEKKRTIAVLATVAKKRGISAAAGPMAAATAASSSQGEGESSSMWGLEMPPAKRMRTASGASSSSSVGSSS